MDRCLYALCRKDRKRIDCALVGLAHADLNPEKHFMKRHMLALTASVVLPLAMIIGSWTIHLNASRMSTAVAATTPNRFKILHQAISKVTGSTTVGAADDLHSKANPSQSFRDPAIEAFLSINQLEHYGPDFQRALEKGRMDNMARRIFGETGLQLVQLASVPDRIRQRYGALTFSVARNQPPVWVLFWRPRLELKRFYHGYKGREIRKLQQRLADLNLYRYNIDGIVGPRLVDSVETFQRQSDLSVTGFPDNETLFWLSHQKNKEIPWPKA
jgi:hypothetical protein